MGEGIKSFEFEPEKATEAILYLASKLPGNNATLYIALKILYLADKAHLSRYGRFISGDDYVAMRYGPVPDGAYNIIKYVRGDGLYPFDHAKNTFSVDSHSHKLIPLRDVDVGLFSQSDIECLDEMIAEHGNKTFGQIKAISHDAAWDSADDNDAMSLVEIAKTLPNADDILQYLSDPFPG